MAAEEGLDGLRQAEAPAQFPAEMLCQEEDVVPPLCQGRNQGRQGAEPVVEVPAEGALPDLLLQGLVGGGDDADIHMDNPVAPHPHDLPLLEGPEELDLQGGAHALHLI